MTRKFSDDERFAVFLRGAVAAMPAPEPPREAMWAAIAAQRRGGAAVAFTAPASTVVNYRSRMSIWTRAVPLRLAAPIAAGLLLVGTGIGVTLGNKGEVKGAPVDVVANGPAVPLPKTLPAQLAASSHFDAVRRLLVDFSSISGSVPVQNASNDTELGKANAALGVWARQLLTTTQVMLDSPKLDPNRRALLRDMERVLLQLTQLSSDNALPADLEFMEQDIANAQLVKRLQSALPANLQQGI